ncbi:hypothetical protein SDC9_13966 [bioreactor metagenome]|uniref:CarD-like/TRCF RNAP-interacting domain-containing protein n=1 Tax=bioreactor metagenome TaxID=1076179 RepID=A0A644TMQ8_9ZZZZ
MGTLEQRANWIKLSKCVIDNNTNTMLEYKILTRRYFYAIILNKAGGAAMLTVGDKVVYPMHGAGVIQAIEEHEVLGQRQQYYILRIPYGGMKVMIPLHNVDNVGLREVIGNTEVEKVADILKAEPDQVNANWNRRFNMNLAKIKSGSIYEVAEVVRNLMQQDHAKKLSTGERRLLDTAKHIMVSELVLACDKDADRVESWIDGLLQENTPGN